MIVLMRRNGGFSSGKKSKERGTMKRLQKHTRKWKSVIFLYHENIKKYICTCRMGWDGKQERDGQNGGNGTGGADKDVGKK
jgi:hypothetical protein